MTSTKKKNRSTNRPIDYIFDYHDIKTRSKSSARTSFDRKWPMMVCLGFIFVKKGVRPAVKMYQSNVLEEANLLTKHRLPTCCGPYSAPCHKIKNNYSKLVTQSKKRKIIMSFDNECHLNKSLFPKLFFLKHDYFSIKLINIVFKS